MYQTNSHGWHQKINQLTLVQTGPPCLTQLCNAHVV